MRVCVCHTEGGLPKATPFGESGSGGAQPEADPGSGGTAGHGNGNTTDCRKKKYAKMASPVIFGMSQNGLCILKVNLSGASIALNFDRPKRTESYKNKKSNIFYPITNK